MVATWFISSLLEFISLSIIILSFIYAAHINTSFLFIAEQYHGMVIPQFVYPLTLMKNCIICSLWPLKIKVAMNIQAQVFV